VTTRKSKLPTIVTYAHDFHQGARALQSSLKGFKVTHASSLELASKTPGDVVVLLMSGWPGRNEKPIASTEVLDRLKHRRVVGIGYGAGNVFDALGLEINSGATAGAGRSGYGRIWLQQNDLLPRESGSFMAHRPTRRSGIPMDCAMYIPERSPLRQEVDVLARWSADPLYAPIVRQGHHLFIGYLDVRRWTPNFWRYFMKVLVALGKRPRSRFRIARWETALPGRRKFDLTPHGSSVGYYIRDFHFQFRKPTRLIAHLRSQGSRNLQMYVHSVPSPHNSNRGGYAHGRSGKSIRLIYDVSRPEINTVSPGYWRLHIVNWDFGRGAQCSLTLDF
jgi:hypothetical protein